jgi:hypothetical protein
VTQDESGPLHTSCQTSHSLPTHVDVGSVHLALSKPYETTTQWIGQRDVLMQLLACWIKVDAADLPLTPRLMGPPGVGKTQLAISAAHIQTRPLYIYQCTADTRPEDLLITPVLSQQGQIAYHASPLVTAMLVGGICILDEGNRMNEKSWASLAPLLDGRRYVESIVAGVTIPAAAEFRAAVTMNQDESTFEIPDYILSRLQPTLEVGFPSKQDEMAILQYHLPFAEPEMLAMTVEFLQHSHSLKLDFSPRDGINMLRFAMKRMIQDPEHPVSRDAAWREALAKCLGEDALDLEAYARRQKRTLGGNAVPMGLADLFFDPDDPLNPDCYEFDEDVDDDGDEDDDDEFDSPDRRSDLDTPF